MACQIYRCLRRASLSPLLLALALASGCASSTAKKAPANKPAKAPYKTLLRAAHCWSGPAWITDASHTQAQRIAQSKAQCLAVLATLGHDEGQLTPLRAVASQIVKVLARSFEASAHAERKHMGRLLAALSQMHRNGQSFRRALRRIVAAPTDAGVIRKNAGKLAPHDGIEMLLHKGFGPYTADARVLGMLGALTRLRGSRELAPQLRVRAVIGPLQSVFGVTPPRLGADPSSAHPGVFVRYMARVAVAAGVKMPGAGVTPPAPRVQLAWRGMLRAFGKRLRTELPRLSAEGRAMLRPLAENISAQLDPKAG